MEIEFYSNDPQRQSRHRLEQLLEKGTDQLAMKDEITVFVGPTKKGKQQVKVKSSNSADTQVNLTRRQRTEFYVAHDDLRRRHHAQQLDQIAEMTIACGFQIIKDGK
jgi:hypothetical protein